MAEDIQGLIEKINQEGVKSAEDNARRIKEQALLEAEGIVAKAKAQAQGLLSEAKDAISKLEEKEKTLLSQAGRDMLLVLRKEINDML